MEKTSSTQFGSALEQSKKETNKTRAPATLKPAERHKMKYTIDNTNGRKTRYYIRQHLSDTLSQPLFPGKLFRTRENADRALAIYTALQDLFYTLNPNFLASLEEHTAFITDDQQTLADVIKDFAQDPSHSKFIESFKELKENNSVSCMESYYELIDYMIGG